MSKFLTALKQNILKRLPAIILAVVVTAVVGLYYIGVFDISIIDRPDSWKGNLSSFWSMLKGENTDETEPTEPTDTEPAEPVDTGKDNSSYAQHGAATTVSTLTIGTVEEKLKEGYKLTDKKWDNSCVFSTLSASVEWPSAFSYGKKETDVEVLVEHEDGVETERTVEKQTVARKALELYMGYIIYDDCGTQYILNSDGKVLTKYDDSYYIPAYTRDLDGRPLFYISSKTNVKYPIELGKEDDDGNREWEETSTISVDTKKYYYLGTNGVTFHESDYNDVTDNRGLYFDYPSYYGNTDSKYKRYYLNSTAVVTTKNKKKTYLEYRLNWLYTKDNDFKLSDYIFTDDGYVLDKEETTSEKTDKTKLTELKEMFPYTMAYNYSEDYAVVNMDIEWKYTHEYEEKGEKKKEKVDVTTNELRIVNEDGKVMFESTKDYYMVNDWTAFQRFAEPISKSISELGSYYFDHGLIRIRKVAFDRYYFTDLDSEFIVSDEDVLVNSKGEEFNIPTGYNLISYSDGILLLEKDGVYRYYTYKNTWLIDKNYADASPFLEGVAVCQNNEELYGVINSEGKTVIPFRYNYISNISSGIMVAYSETSGWTVFEKLAK